MESLGEHYLIELYDCDPDILDDLNAVKDIMLDAAKKSGATVIKEFLHKFSPQGVSGVVVIAESHLAIHTWPENRYAAVDFFTCGKKVRPLVAYECLKKEFDSKNSIFKCLKRGKVEESIKVTA